MFDITIQPSNNRPADLYSIRWGDGYNKTDADVTVVQRVVSGVVWYDKDGNGIPRGYRRARLQRDRHSDRFQRNPRFGIQWKTIDRHDGQKTEPTVSSAFPPVADIRFGSLPAEEILG